jgi:hypothetical protein
VGVGAGVGVGVGVAVGGGGVGAGVGGGAELREPNRTAIWPYTPYAASNSLRLIQYWPRSGSLRRTLVSLTPVTTTACSCGPAYGIVLPSKAT